MYIGHVGDSGIVLGYEDPTTGSSADWKARPLTQDHKPECDVERSRIMSSGGKVVAKSGVSRVVWTRPRLGHKGPIRRSTPIDEIPFLAVARSLGDLWSYNSQHNEFVVSPEPDVAVVTIDRSFRCLVFGTDGLWNVLSPHAAVDIVRNAEHVNDRNYYCSKELLNPSRSLVNRALEKWSTTRVRADNTSVVTIMLDPPGGPKRRQFPSTAFDRQQVGHSQHHQRQQYDQDWHTMEEACLNRVSSARHVAEELDLLNESLYNNTTHQFQGEQTHQHHHHHQQHLLVPGGDLLASPSSHHVNYENYMNLSSTTTNHQFQQTPPGGFLQSHLQGSAQMMQSMAMQFHVGGDGDMEGVEESEGIVDYEGFAEQQQQQQPATTTALPTFSHLMEERQAAAAAASAASSYSLTRLETRLEQLTHSVSSNSSMMYANYQQLVETPSCYSPQVDLDTINTFHDYAGVPQQQQHQMEEENEENRVEHLPGAPLGTDCFAESLIINTTPQLDYGMEQDKFHAWSGEWHHGEEQSQQQHPPAASSTFAVGHDNELQPEQMPEQVVESVNANVPMMMGESSSEATCLDDVSQATAAAVEGMIGESPPSVVILVPAALSPTIQIHEITSSGGVASTAQQQQQHLPLPLDSSPVPANESDDDKKSEPEEDLKGNALSAIPVVVENVRVRRLRCPVSSSSASSSSSSPSSSVEKENKSRPATPLKGKRTFEAAPPPTLAVTTRSTTTTTTSTTSTTCVETRKSAAAAAAALLRGGLKRRSNGSSVAAIKSALRSTSTTTASAGVVAVKKSSLAAVATGKRGNLLLSSSKFNQQQQEKEKGKQKKGDDHVGKLKRAAVKPDVGSSSTSGIGRRLSKRDKVRNNSKVAAGSTSWKSANKSTTVQTRNRVQKR